MEPSVLRGLRREMTKETFEELAALQCAVEEILGYVSKAPLMWRMVTTVKTSIT